MAGDAQAGSWRELAAYLGTAVVLAGGVLVGAVNIYVAASLLPTAIGEIGGADLYAWNMTVFLVAQVIATMLVSNVLLRRGNVGSYLIGFEIFTAGSVVCAVSPVMPVLLVGRGVQGLGAGLLSGLGFAVVQSAFPARLWARGNALMSAMFALGNFVGPAIGGVFAQVGSWRLAFVVLAVAAVAMGVFVPRVLPRGAYGTTAPAVPVPSLVLVSAAAAAVSVAGIAADVTVMAVTIAAALVLLAGFVLTERRARARVLPALTYRAGSPLKWVYLTIAALGGVVAVETFIPLFGQRLGGLPPVAAGFFGAALSLGWSLTQIASSSARRDRTVRRLRTFGPGVAAIGFAALALLQHPHAPLPVVIGWLPALLVAGAGIGLAFPHLSVAAMASSDDPEEGKKAAAAIATVVMMSTAIGVAVAGLLVNLGAPSTVASARYLMVGFAVIAAAGMLTARRSSPVRGGWSTSCRPLRGRTRRRGPTR